MHEDEPRPLTDAELEQDGGLLPDREAMSIITPGGSGATPAAAMLPDEATAWHGPPGEAHVL